MFGRGVTHTDFTGSVFYDSIPSYSGRMSQADSAETNIICVAVASAEES